MRKIFFIIISVISFTCMIASKRVLAQSLPVGTPVLDDYYRRLQLLGKVDSNISFTVRSLFPTSSLKIRDVYDPDSTLNKDHWISTGSVSFAKGLATFQILPLTWQQQYNSDHPYGWNDGAMIPAKGYQTMISGGFFIKYGLFSIQLRPEYVYATNPVFTGYATGSRTDQDLSVYYNYYSQIDWPERYGNSCYSKLFWGQSSIRLALGSVSAGVSNENLWWGPGIRNSLLLSNNAPGFKHFTLNTVHPIKILIGFIEGQIIAGRLDASGFPPLAITTLSNGKNVFTPKLDDWRYFTGININYHPKWISGLALGLTRTFNAYHQYIKGFSAYFPFFFPYQKKNTNDGDPFPRDQYTSLYARWLFTKANAEVYFEYGLNDNSYNYRDFISSPEHSRAYLFGIRKMIPLLGKFQQNILFSAEITQLSQSPDRLLRDANGWYIHYGATDGHTNQGQILGAGTGSGGNLQSMDVSWVYGLKKLGIGLERYEHNVDFYRTVFPDINNNSRKWVDFAFALNGEWNYKNLIFNAKLQEIKSLNYEWVLKDYDPSKYYIPHNDVFNFHGELGVTFRF